MQEESGQPGLPGHRGAWSAVGAPHLGRGAEASDAACLPSSLPSLPSSFLLPPVVFLLQSRVEFMGPFRSERPPSSISRSLLCYFPRHPGACLSPPLPRAPTPALRVPARELGVCPYKHGCGLVALRSASPGLPAHTASCGRAPGPRPRPPCDAPRSGVAAPAAPGHGTARGAPRAQH